MSNIPIKIGYRIAKNVTQLVNQKCRNVISKLDLKLAPNLTDFSETIRNQTVKKNLLNKCKNSPKISSKMAENGQKSRNFIKKLAKIWPKNGESGLKNRLETKNRPGNWFNSPGNWKILKMLFQNDLQN